MKKCEVCKRSTPLLRYAPTGTQNARGLNEIGLVCLRCLVKRRRRNAGKPDR